MKVTYHIVVSAVVVVSSDVIAHVVLDLKEEELLLHENSKLLLPLAVISL